MLAPECSFCSVIDNSGKRKKLKQKNRCSPSRYDGIELYFWYWCEGSGKHVCLIAGAAPPPRGDARDHQNQSSSDCHWDEGNTLAPAFILFIWWKETCLCFVLQGGKIMFCLYRGKWTTVPWNIVNDPIKSQRFMAVGGTKDGTIFFIWLQLV